MWTRAWGDRIIFNHGTSNSQGTAFLIRNNDIKVNSHIIIEPGRLSFLEFTHEGLDYCMANIYAPNKDETNLVEQLLNEVYGRNKKIV